MNGSDAQCSWGRCLGIQIRLGAEDSSADWLVGYGRASAQSRHLPNLLTDREQRSYIHLAKPGRTCQKLAQEVSCDVHADGRIARASKREIAATGDPPTAGYASTVID